MLGTFKVPGISRLSEKRPLKLLLPVIVDNAELNGAVKSLGVRHLPLCHHTFIYSIVGYCVDV